MYQQANERDSSVTPVKLTVASLNCLQMNQLSGKSLQPKRRGRGGGGGSMSYLGAMAAAPPEGALCFTLLCGAGNELSPRPLV